MIREKTFFEQQLEKISGQYGLPEYQYIRARQSKHFMEKYYSGKIELDTIAAAACMSRFHFVRLFQTIYGTTPRQYLKNLRIDKAKALLKKGASVADTCYQVGYDSIPTFSRVFKLGAGLSPRDYQLLNYSNPG